jgi:hypothetical protein
VVFGEQAFMIGTVRIVANRAFADRRRAVQKIEAPRYLVAIAAHFRYALLNKQKFVIAVVRLVTLKTVPLLHGIVNELLVGLVEMAGFAKVSALACELIGVFFNLDRLVARFAVAKAHRPVYMGLLAFGAVRMAFRGNTRLLLCRGLLDAHRFSHRKRYQ